MKIRIGIPIALAICSFHGLPAVADEAATIAQIKSAVLEIDQAYADEELHELVRGHGFDDVSRHSSLEGIPSPGQEAFFALVAKKRPTTEDA